MADDFPKIVSKTAGVLKTHFLNENFAWIPSSSLRIRRCCMSLVGGIIICILFLVLARFAIEKQKMTQYFLISSKFDFGLCKLYIYSDLHSRKNV